MKNKILLVFEDFNELTKSQNYLKRVGFDVVSLSNEFSVNEQIITFFPDVIVIYGLEVKIRNFHLVQKILDGHKYHGKLVLIFNSQQMPPIEELNQWGLSAIIEAPFLPETLIGALGNICEINPKTLVNKLHKQGISEIKTENTEAVIVQGASSVVHSETIKIEDHTRSANYSQWLKNSPLSMEKLDHSRSSHSKEEIKKRIQELKKGWDPQKLDEQDRLKREFAAALFKKK